MNKNENVILDHSGCEEIFTELPIFNCKNFYGIKLKAEKIVSVDAYIKNNVNIENADFTILSLARVRIGDTLYLTKSKLVEFYISDSIVKRIDARELFMKIPRIMGTKIYDESKITNTKIETLDLSNSKLDVLLIFHSDLKEILLPCSEIKNLTINNSNISNYLNMNFSSFELSIRNSKIKYMNMNDSNIRYLSMGECTVNEINIINSEIENDLNLTEVVIKNLNLEETKVSEDLLIQGSEISQLNLQEVTVNRMSLKNTKIRSIYFPGTINELDLRGTRIKNIISEFPTVLNSVLINDSTKVPSNFEKYVRQFI